MVKKVSKKKIIKKALTIKMVPEIVGKLNLPTEEQLNSISKKEINDMLKEMALEKIKRKMVLNKFSEAMSKVETQDDTVTDIVVNLRSFMILRKFGKDVFYPTCDGIALKNRFFGTLWGINIWIFNNKDDISCFKKGSKELKKIFPEVAKGKKFLKL